MTQSRQSGNPEEVTVRLRRDLHRHPELSGREQLTARRIIAFIAAYSPDETLENIGGHGFCASYIFAGEGPEIAIRCELDALPIDEANPVAHASISSGVSHKCGHDGHMAVVAGLAAWLSTRPFGHGKVRLLFQPSEENGQGAQAWLADPRMAGFSPDYIFALHNLPGYRLHEILVVRQQFSATVLSLAIYFEGAVAHAAQPEKGLNPSLAISDALIAIQQLANPAPANLDYALVTPVYTRIGSPDYGISAGEGEVHFTLRTWREERMGALLDSIIGIVSAISDKYRLRYRTQQFDYFPTVMNDEQCNQLIIETAKHLGFPVTVLEEPMRFGEDFGFFTQKGKGAMFGLGAGLQTPPLHNPAYDFPDALLQTGISMFKGVISKLLDSSQRPL